MLGGCCWVGYKTTSPTGQVISGWYMRFADQELQGVSVKTTDGMTVEITKQNAEAAALADIAATAKNLSGAIK